MQRKRTIHNRRGFTLVELTIVMAITAIISVMIVSFSTLISAQTRKNNLRADFLDSVITLRTDLQKEFAIIDNGETIEKLDEGRKIKIKNNELAPNVSEYENIDSILFDVSNQIVKVTVTNAKLGESQSFILISKVGES